VHVNNVDKKVFEFYVWCIGVLTVTVPVYAQPSEVVEN
jgi:hypothetical protein